jgi:Mrp family chromosome partitioning ATPase
MSNYFQTLNRLERERSASRAVEAPLFDDVDAIAELEPAEADAVRADAETSPVAVIPTPAPAVVPVPVVAKPRTNGLAARKTKKVTPQSAVLDKITPVAEAPAAAPASIAMPHAPKRKIGKHSLLDAKSAAGDGQIPYVTLFDNLRAVTNPGPVRKLVVAGASQGDRVGQVTAGLGTLARRRGLHVLLADIEEGVKQPVLRARNANVHEAMPGNGRRHSAAVKAAAQTARYGSPVALDLRGGTAGAEVNDWLASAADAHDMVIVEAPALGLSVDAALLARGCDGLIIVVDSATTTKDSLRVAVERAQASGCRILGLVMTGTRRVMPDWMTRMAGSAHGN